MCHENPNAQFYPEQLTVTQLIEQPLVITNTTKTTAGSSRQTIQ
jgi:hypothetical protein